MKEEMKMTILSIIFGVIMIIGGCCLMFTPLATFLSTGYYILILFCVCGFFGIIRAIVQKRIGLNLVFSLVSLILGILGFVFPQVVRLNEIMIIYCAATWFIIRGVISIVSGVNAPKELVGMGSKIFSVIFGIIEIALGGYSFAHPVVLAITIGYLIGFYFIESGINTMVLGSLASRKKFDESEYDSETTTF